MSKKLTSEIVTKSTDNLSNTLHQHIEQLGAELKKLRKKNKIIKKKLRKAKLRAVFLKNDLKKKDVLIEVLASQLRNRLNDDTAFKSSQIIDPNPILLYSSHLKENIFSLQKNINIILENTNYVETDSKSKQLIGLYDTLNSALKTALIEYKNVTPIGLQSDQPLTPYQIIRKPANDNKNVFKTLSRLTQLGIQFPKKTLKKIRFKHLLTLNKALKDEPGEMIVQNFYNLLGEPQTEASNKLLNKKNKSNIKILLSLIHI